MDTAMQPLDTVAFDAAEAVIARGQATFLEVGAAIATIRDGGKAEYRRRGYATFEDYMRRRWGWSRTHGYALIAAVGVAENVVSGGHSEGLGFKHTAALAPLPAAEQRHAWAEAVRTSADGKPRVSDLRKVVKGLDAERRAEQAATRAAQPRPGPAAPASLPAAACLLVLGDPIPAEAVPDGVHLTVTSPAYALGIDYADGGDVAPERYRAYMHDLLAEIHRYTVMGGRLALNVPLDVSLPETYPTFYIAMEAAVQSGWYYRFSIVWNEGNVSRSVARGSVDSASAPHVIAPVEMIAVFYKGGYEAEYVGEGPPPRRAVLKGTPGYVAKPDGRMWGWKRTPPPGVRSDLEHAEWLEWTNGLWTFPGESRPWEGFPAAFPEELPRRLIKLLSFPGETVCDPCMGSGTTGIAALRLGRKFIGFDRSPTYVASAKRRFAAVFG